MAELIANLRAAWRAIAAHLDGRCDRAAALAKLAAFDPRIGHPMK